MRTHQTYIRRGEKYTFVQPDPKIYNWTLKEAPKTVSAIMKRDNMLSYVPPESFRYLMSKKTT
jgi:hypothetical protein